MAQSLKKSAGRIVVRGSTYKLVGRTIDGLPVVEPKKKPVRFTVRQIKNAMRAARIARASSETESGVK